jgi:hypothetical protein
MDTAMRTSHCLLTLAAFLAALAVGGCGSREDKAAPVSTSLSVWNRTQTDLLELRLHDSAGYTEATNLLTTPLAVESSLEVAFVQGQYVTVFRHRVANDDPMAFTTARALNEVAGAGYTLVVFDRSFRLLSPGE